MIGNVDIKARPLRLAYLVDPRDPDQIRDAIRLSSTLWGGAYFPIIPLYKRLPNSWKQMHLRGDKIEVVLQGYLEAFDPDVLVGVSQDIPEIIKNSGLDIVPPTEIWQVLATGLTLSPSYGVGIFELLGDIFEQHFRYKAKYPVKVVFPKVPQGLSLFWASVFGEIPQILDAAINARFRDAVEINDVDFTTDQFSDMMKANVLFPRRIAQYGLNHVRRTGIRGREARAFYFDATKTEDIIDFWNLRALGQPVFPIPKQLQNDAGVRASLLEFLKAHRIPWPHNPKVRDHAAVVRSRHSTMDQMQEFGQSFPNDQSIDPSAFDSLFSLQHWYPRMWDEWARDKDAAIPDDLYADDEHSIDLAEKSDLTIHLKSLLPSFAAEHVYHDNPRCANDISFHLYGTDQYFAEVFPKPAGTHLMRAVGGMTSSRDEWRISRGRLARLIKRDFSEWLTIPLAENVMTAWLTDLGWKPKLSPPGILAKQIYAQLDGHLFPLHHEKLLGLLEHMNGGNVNRDHSPVSDNSLTAELERDLPIGEIKNRLTTAHGNLYEHLVSKGVFRLGNRVQCPQCMRNSWFSLPNVQESLTCPKCLRTFSALGNLTNGVWTYKTAGPFSVPAYAEGAYTVLLTIEFFSDRKFPTIRTTPIFSFTAEAPGKGKLEADCALLWEESVYGERRDGVLFCECKTYGKFRGERFRKNARVGEGISRRDPRL